MNALANPLCWLAPRMRLHSCVHLVHRRSKDTPTGLPKLRFEDILCRWSTVPSTCGDDEELKDSLLNQEMAFNIHNPSITHRVR